MRNCLIWLSVLSFTSCYLVEARPWRAESSLNHGNLGLNPLFLSPITDTKRSEDIIDNDDGLENIDLIEGDIIPDDDVGEDRSAVARKNKLWPRGIIPYVIELPLDDHRREITDAMRFLEHASCLRFVPRTTENNYVSIFKGSGCFSKIGMSGGPQKLSLGPGCYQKGMVMHELLHAAGFYHEQSRSDRDGYLDIHWENIRKGYESQFTKNKPHQEQLITPYDYQSVMHYSSYSFSKDKVSGLKTMTPKQEGVVLRGPGQKLLSPSDIKRIAVLYKCALPA